MLWSSAWLEVRGPERTQSGRLGGGVEPSAGQDLRGIDIVFAHWVLSYPVEHPFSYATATEEIELRLGPSKCVVGLKY